MTGSVRGRIYKIVLFETYMYDAIVPPRLPMPTCNAMPTLRLVLPPTLFEFQQVHCGTLV